MKVAVIVPTRSPELLALNIAAHGLFSGGRRDDEMGLVCDERLEFFVVNTQPAGAPWLPLPGQWWTRSGDPQDRYSGWNHRAAEWVRDDLRATHLVFSNDDVVVTPGWLDTMLEDLAELKARGIKPGLLGACSNHAAGAQAYIGAGGLGNGRVIGHAEQVPGVPLPQGWRWAPVSEFDGPMPCANVMTQFALIETSAYFDAGGFDLDLPAHSCSDIALCYRLVKAGYTNAVSRAFVCHFGSRTLGADRDAHLADLRAGRAYMDKTYPDHEAVLGFRWNGVGA